MRVLTLNLWHRYGAWDDRCLVLIEKIRGLQPDLVGVLKLFSPGKPRPFLDENGRPLAGSISEKIHVNINGVEQGMFIKSKDLHYGTFGWNLH